MFRTWSILWLMVLHSIWIVNKLISSSSTLKKWQKWLQNGHLGYLGIFGVDFHAIIPDTVWSRGRTVFRTWRILWLMVLHSIWIVDYFV